MKRDVTGRAVERAAAILVRAQKRMAERVPLGPTQVQLTPAEFRKLVDRAPRDTVAQLVDALGTDKFMGALLGAGAARLREEYPDEGLV